MKKILSLAVLFSALFVNSLYAADFRNIEVIDNGNITMEVTPDISLNEGNFESDMKVLKDYFVSSADLDIENTKKINLAISYDLEAEKSYTIIWIDWAEANMNFTTNSEIVWEYLNSEKGTWLQIEKINILDSKNIEIYYNQDITAESFIFMFLSELKIKEKVSDGDSLVAISLSEPLEELASYIVLANSITDKNGKILNLTDEMYEFSTGANLENIFWDKAKKTEVQNTWNLEEVALNSEKTPETWAATWILILLTLALTTWIIVTWRKA